MSPNLAALFFLLISLKLSYCSTGNNLCQKIEKQALLGFKQSLKDPSNLLSSWKDNEINCCKWKGVVCDDVTGHVRQLRLQSSDGFQVLGGKLNLSLLNLEHLRYLDLSLNDFDETIPSFIGSLTRLEYLDLSQAGFYGTIPHTIGKLSNLRTFSLEGNSFRSRLDVDSIEWLSGLSRLEHLNMNHVNLSRAANWQQVINTLPSLVELRFGYCSLSFIAPPNNANSISTSLSILDLSYNKFRSFAIPSWIFRLENLTFLDLSGNSFEGPIPTTSNTTKLQHIDLSDNKLKSTIPDWLYSCKDLEFAYFSSSFLRGAISSNVANLTSLNTLSLSWNELSGEIPREIGSLCKLQSLDLSLNKLHGNISDSFGNMSDCFLGSLEALDLSENQLSGHLTDQFGKFTSLKTLRLAGNSLSGAIPINLGNVLSLETLNIADNKLSGNLPVSLGQLFNLKFLHIENNKFEGVVSESHFSNLTNLMDLYASGNRLTLKVSSNWIPPFNLASLGLGSWNLGFGSTIPQWLDSQKSVWELDLSSTAISGEVPSWIWEIQYLNLSHNHLRGKIPDMINSELMCLSSNKFSGPLPRIGSDVNDLDLSNNSFSGDIYHFLCDIANETTYSLEILKLDGNRLTGQIPDCLMKWSLIRVLNLGNNNMFGSIPNSIGFLTNMLSLNLQNNKFSGHIPFSMRNCTKLVNIDLADNDLDGKIPTWIGTSVIHLRFLVLRSNKLSGEISPDICHLNYLQILDFSDNGFSGIIPRCIDNFTAMATKRSLRDRDGGVVYTYYGTGVFAESVSVATKGSELHYDTILPLVTNIDLSKNNLSGDIPKELTSLVELRSLNLSGNHLTGFIPSNIGDMRQLESLDLSTNLLSGEMPNSFTVMSSLNYLNVSYNNLTGRIPESTQIQGFNASSFIGNDLCGPPLTSNCISSGGPNTNREDNESDDKSSTKVEWFYVFMSLGYAVGFSVFCTTLILKKSWREAYFELIEDTCNKVYVYFYIKWRKITS